MLDSLCILLVSGHCCMLTGVLPAAQLMASPVQVKCIVLDGPDSWAQLMQREGVIAKFCPIDFSDAEHVFENCRKVRYAAPLLSTCWTGSMH